jgi:isopentenyldiphosphate isomerase
MMNDDVGGKMIEPSSDTNNAQSNAAQDPNECLEIMLDPIVFSSYSRQFDPYHDKPISTTATASRSLVHQNALWHNSVLIWIVSPSSPSSDRSSSSNTADILLQKRSSTKDTFPNRYDISCAGHVSFTPIISTNHHRYNDDNSTNDATNTNHIYYGHENYSLLDTLRAELSEELGWIDGIHVDVASELRTPAFIIPAQQSHLGGCNAFEHVYFLVRHRRRCLDSNDDDDNNATEDDLTRRNDKSSIDPSTSTPIPKSVGRFSLGSAEVSEVVWRPVNEVLNALRSGDEKYAPRTGQYVDFMEKELNRILHRGGGNDVDEDEVGT